MVTSLAATPNETNKSLFTNVCVLLFISNIKFFKCFNRSPLKDNLIGSNKIHFLPHSKYFQNAQKQGFIFTREIIT